MSSSSGNQRYFDAVDYAVFAAMLIVSAGIGIYHRLTGGRQRTVNEYLLADRKMAIFPVAFSLMASFMSAITILGVAAENYSFGTQFFVINIAYIFGTPIAAFIYLPVFFRIQATSVYEYLERRFGRASRLAASAIFQLQMVVYMGIVLYAPALAFSAVSGLSKWTSVISVGLVCTFYSTIGGMKAVLWTDVFQSFLMFAAIFAVLIKGFVDADSIRDFFTVVNDGKRFEFFRFDFDPTVRHTVWTQTIGGIFSFLTLYGVNQAQVQRLLTIGNLNKSQASLFVSWPILLLLSLSTSTCGLVMYYKYRTCDPLMSGRVSSPDQLLPLFVMDFLSNYPGISGLFVSGVFSATLSTVSSAVNSLAAVTLEDFLKPSFHIHWTDVRQALASKMLVLLYGCICLALTYVAEQLGGVLQASLTIFGVVGGPLLGLFSLGMFSVKSNQKGAMIGFITSLLIVSWIGFGAHIHKVKIPKLPYSVAGCDSFISRENSSGIINTLNINNSLLTITPTMPNNTHIWFIYRISYMWLAPIGFTWVFVVGYLVSILTGGYDGKVDSSLISPPFHRFHGLVQRKIYENDKVLVSHNDELNIISKSNPPLGKSEECTTHL